MTILDIKENLALLAYIRVVQTMDLTHHKAVPTGLGKDLAAILKAPATTTKALVTHNLLEITTSNLVDLREEQAKVLSKDNHGQLLKLSTLMLPMLALLDTMDLPALLSLAMKKKISSTVLELMQHITLTMSSDMVLLM